MEETSPVIAKARKDGLTEFAVLPFDLMRVATGNPMIVTLNGKSVLLRLPTPEEAMQFQRESVHKLMAQEAYNLTDDNLVTQEMAENLVKPIGIQG